MCTCKRVILAIALLAGALIGCVAHACESAPTSVEQQVRIAGRTLRYRAETGRVAIRDTESGEAHGHMFYTAYRAPSTGPRPVVFLWNGGPGANSVLLHFDAFGPKRLQDGELIANAETLLTVADLVFVDPIGTGFSRPAKSEYADEFYGTLGDIASVTEFVRAWRLLHDAEDTPIFLIGESWGAGRAGSVGYSLEALGIPVSGLVLISGGSGIDAGVPPELREALRIVDFAATAIYHGKITPAGGDRDIVLAAAESWARNTYAPALARLAGLSPGERDAIAATLAGYTGLPVDNIDRASLRVTPRQFRTELLAGEDKILDTFDMRQTGEGGAGSSARVIDSYLRHELGYRTDLVYLGLSGGFERGYSPGGQTPPSVNERWNYFTAPMSDEEKQAAFEEAMRTGAGPPRGGPPPPSTGEALALDPDIKVLVAAGRYDSFANCAADREAQARLEGALAHAVEYHCYEGGHMMYRDKDARRQFTDDVRTMIADAMQ